MKKEVGEEKGENNHAFKKKKSIHVYLKVAKKKGKAWIIIMEFHGDKDASVQQIPSDKVNVSLYQLLS